MEQLINEFPDNIRHALDVAKKANIRKSTKKINNIVVCGMGGSGIGGKIIGQLFVDELEVPFISVQDYALPAFVNENTLVIASSYSGDTEETLIACETAIQKNAQMIAICSGGKVGQLAKDYYFDCIIVPGGRPPRAALAFSIVQLVQILIQKELVSSHVIDDFEKGAAYLIEHKNAIQTEAKKIADYIGKGIPVFYSGSDFEGIAIRARQQLNENAKTLCWHHVIPEMNHNELVGWSGGNEQYKPVFICNQSMNKRNVFRLELSKKVMEEKAGKVYVLQTKGSSKLVEYLYAIHLLDWTSWYVSQQKNEDAMAIPVIDYLKSELNKF
jgi:glucose/mannose-6-phosphate isomerase